MSYVNAIRSDSLIRSALQRLVPDVCVDSVEIRTGHGSRLYLQVSPEHFKYWSRFQDRYPEFIFLACKRYGALTRSEGLTCLCPEFLLKRDLFGWLACIACATQKKRDFLRFYMRTQSCHSY